MSLNIREMTADEILNLPKLGLDDSFEFTCKACGKCCRQRQDILLTPYDMFSIAKYLGRTPDEIFIRYCEVYKGSNSHFPVVRVVPTPPNNTCPFLRDRRCSVHAKKPVVCRVYPLGRISIPDQGVQYFFAGSGCNHEPTSIKVRDWLADAASKECEEAGHLWADITSTILPLMQPGTFPYPGETQSLVLTTIFKLLWLNYDMEDPFAPQLQQNFETIKDTFEKTGMKISQEE